MLIGFQRITSVSWMLTELQKRYKIRQWISMDIHGYPWISMDQLGAVNKFVALGYKIQAPEIISKIHWLGDQSVELALRVKAKEVCQTLFLERSQLLDLLSSLILDRFFRTFC